MTSLIAQQAMEELLEHVATDPLDLLNKWQAKQVNDDTMFVLMQRALLDIKHNTIRVANPAEFAKQRKAAATNNAPLAHKFTIDVVDKMIHKYGKFSMSDKTYEELVGYAKQMFEDGMRPSQMLPMNMAKGRHGYFHNYEGGKKFTDLLDYILDGNRGA